MKVTCQVSDALAFELDAKDQTDVFEQLSSLQEVFGETTCGKCGKTDLRFVVRENDGNKFYELRCKSCGA